MAIDLANKTFVDPHNGLEALRQKVLDTPATPQESFADDPLRMLRAARFSAQLGFTAAPRVIDAMTSMAEEIDRVEGDALTHRDGPGDGVRGRLDGLGERRLELVVVVPEQQRLVEVVAPRDVRRLHRLVRVEGVLAAATRGAVDQDAAFALRAPTATTTAIVTAAGSEELLPATAAAPRPEYLNSWRREKPGMAFRGPFTS